MTPHDNHDTSAEFRVWLRHEKRTLVDKSLQEATAIHERIKNRLFSALSLTTTLSSASFAGAFAHQSYSLICWGLGFGFAAVAGLCILGLRSRVTMTANVGPETVDRIMSLSSPARTVEEGQERMINMIDGTSLQNLKSAALDRRYLMAAWALLFLTPVLACLVAVKVE